MAQQGRAAQALTAAFTSSFVGALFAVVLITFLAPVLAKFALKFGPAEYFAVQLLTFCSFVGMSKEPAAKVIASMMLGFALAAVGMDTVTGQLRMTYGFPELLKGFDFLIAVIGLFGIGEILLTMEEGLAFKGKSAKLNLRVVLQTWAELPRYDVRVVVRMESVARADRHRRPRARGRSCTRARGWQRHNLFVHQVHSPPAAAPEGPPGGAYVRALLSRREDDSALHTRLTRPRTAKSS
jgi:hypothetical protein